MAERPPRDPGWMPPLLFWRMLCVVWAALLVLAVIGGSPWLILVAVAMVALSAVESTGRGYFSRGKRY